MSTQRTFPPSHKQPSTMEAARALEDHTIRELREIIAELGLEQPPAKATKSQICRFIIATHRATPERVPEAHLTRARAKCAVTPEDLELQIERGLERYRETGDRLAAGDAMVSAVRLGTARGYYAPRGPQFPARGSGGPLDAVRARIEEIERERAIMRDLGLARPPARD